MAHHVYVQPEKNPQVLLPKSEARALFYLNNPAGRVQFVFSFERSHPIVVYSYKVIYSVKTQHILVISTINLATCFGSLNHLQANP
jgi:hypothetical protein